jgi:hypothetical protein
MNTHQAKYSSGAWDVGFSQPIMYKLGFSQPIMYKLASQEVFQQFAVVL